MLTSVIGAYPKPSYIKITDWFNAKGGTDTEHPTKFIIMKLIKWVIKLKNYSIKQLKK